MQAFVILVFLPLSSAVTHSLQYFYTATSGLSNCPEFEAVGMVDGLVISQYDSNTRNAVPRQAWMEEHLDQEYWESETELSWTAAVVLKEDIRISKERFNQTEGEHVFQRRYGCVWDDESDVTSGYEQYGYDGEDFISLDLNNMRWVAVKPQAVLTRNKWDAYESSFSSRERYFTQDCRDWLKKYVQYGSSSLRRKVPPEVSLIQYKSSSTVVCHATGFYPDGVMITWKRDGEEIHEDVDMGETLPNGDGTFQKRAVLTVSPEERERSQYTCEVEHISGKQRLVTLTEEDRNIPVSIIIGCVIAAVVVFFNIIGVVIASVKMKKNRDIPVSIITGCVIAAVVLFFIIIGEVIAVVKMKNRDIPLSIITLCVIAPVVGIFIIIGAGIVVVKMKTRHFIVLGITGGVIAAIVLLLI